MEKLRQWLRRSGVVLGVRSFSSGFTATVLLLGGAILLLAFLSTGHTTVSNRAIRTSTRNTEIQITAAIQAYTSEYGHPPGDRSDGRYEDPAGNAQIFAVLRAMDSRRNPRRIVYFEAKNARLSSRSWLAPKRLRDGFDPATGVLFDPYGNPYRIRLWPESSPKVASPYRDVSDSWMTPIVWSLGEDGIQGCPKDGRKFQGSDDILSSR